MNLLTHNFLTFVICYLNMRMRRGQSVSSQLLTSRGDSSACRCECRGGRRRNMEKKQVVEEEHAQILWYVQKDCNIPQLFLLLDFYFIDVNNTIFNVQPGHTCIRFLAMSHGMCFFLELYDHTR